jgi:hypothetical protein
VALEKTPRGVIPPGCVKYCRTPQEFILFYEAFWYAEPKTLVPDQPKINLKSTKNQLKINLESTQNLLRNNSGLDFAENRSVHKLLI